MTRKGQRVMRTVAFGDDARAFVFCLWALNQDGWGSMRRRLDQNSTLSKGTEIVYTQTKAADRPRFVAALRRGNLNRAAEVVPWRKRLATNGLRLVPIDELAEQATMVGALQVPKAVAIARKMLSGRKAESVPAAKEPGEMTLYAQAYEGPLGRVEAVQAEFQLDEHEAAEVVRSAKRPPPQAVQQAFGNDPALVAEVEYLRAALAREKVLNRSLRNLVGAYVPTDLATGGN